jgi:catechol 2,3-dioxygenase-like lactoylglutathione lyase family enzyme
MLDHVGLRVKDYNASKAFYVAALAPLGYAVVMDFPGKGVGFGTADKPVFWVVQDQPTSTNAHVAFNSPDHKTVDAFHAAALAAGGEDNGAPGIREHYHPNYYGAFVFDPDGNNVEAVCHEAQG